MSKPITTLAQLRKEHKAAKAYHFTIDKDFVLIFEDYNYFDDDRHMRMIELMDKADGNTASSYADMIRATDDLFEEWIGEEAYAKLKEKVTRVERARIAGQAGEHFKKAHGVEDPKEKP